MVVATTYEQKVRTKIKYVIKDNSPPRFVKPLVKFFDLNVIRKSDGTFEGVSKFIRDSTPHEIQWKSDDSFEYRLPDVIDDDGDNVLEIFKNCPAG